MTRAIEDHDHEVFHIAIHGFGDLAQVFGWRRIEAHAAFAERTDDDLFHVAVGCVQQSAFFGNSEHGNCTRRAGGAEVRAFEGIDRDVDFRNVCSVGKFGADTFADVEHRRFIAFAFANHDRAVHGNGVHDFAHAFSSDFVREMAVALTHGAGRCNRGLFHDTQELEREVAFNVLTEALGFLGFSSDRLTYVCNH